MDPRDERIIVEVSPQPVDPADERFCPQGCSHCLFSRLLDQDLTGFSFTVKQRTALAAISDYVSQRPASYVDRLITSFQGVEGVVGQLPLTVPVNVIVCELGRRKDFSPQDLASYVKSLLLTNEDEGHARPNLAVNFVPTFARAKFEVEELLEFGFRACRAIIAAETVSNLSRLHIGLDLNALSDPVFRGLTQMQLLEMGLTLQLVRNTLIGVFTGVVDEESFLLSTEYDDGLPSLHKMETRAKFHGELGAGQVSLGARIMPLRGFQARPVFIPNGDFLNFQLMRNGVWFFHSPSHTQDSSVRFSYEDFSAMVDRSVAEQKRLKDIAFEVISARRSLAKV